jgi:tetratricopeptide (TPR) repeat protein
MTEGVQLHQSGMLGQAASKYAQVLRAQPAHFDALHLSGLIAYQAQNSELAVNLMKQALLINPKSVACLVNLGLAQHSLGHTQDAYSLYEAALAIDPVFAPAYFNRGNLHKDLGEWSRAVIDYEAAIALVPSYWEAYLNCGFAKEQLTHYEHSLRLYQRVLVICPSCTKVYNNRANVFKALSMWHEALTDYDRCIHAEPSYVDAYVNKANLLKEHGLVELARDQLSQALHLDAQHASALWSKGLLDLAQGEFERGWPAYESRWRLPKSDSGAPSLFSNNPQVLSQFEALPPSVQWRGGASIQGKRLLIYAEQGLGDSLQFVRFVPLLVHMGASVCLAVQPSLVSLFACALAIDWTQHQLISWTDELGAFDLACPLMSLPLALGLTQPEQFEPTPYLKLELQNQARTDWMERLKARSQLRVGVAWRGNPHHAGDRFRSMEWREFERCLERGAHYVNLQKDTTQDERELLSQAFDVLDASGELDSFLDTAGLCANLDLVICVDTSVAHLAAALGIEVWLLVPLSCDWRWMLNTAQSPWYKTLKIYRQSDISNWEPVLGRVKKDLSTRLLGTAQ